MKYLSVFGSIGVITLCLVTSLVATSAQAYEVVKTEAKEIDDRHTLYLITYAFGHQSYSYALPSMAIRGRSDNTTDLEYRLTTPEGLTVKDGLAVAKIITNAKLENDLYHVATNTKTAFTLAVLHQKADLKSRANTLQVTAFPFTIANFAAMLNNHELRPYRAVAPGTPVRIELE